MTEPATESSATPPSSDDLSAMECLTDGRSDRSGRGDASNDPTGEASGAEPRSWQRDSARSEVSPIVRVQGFRKVYAGVCAVEDLSFDVWPGQIFGFIGPNGAGKTTTLRAIATLLEPTAGTITVDGLDIDADPIGVRRVLGYMPDNFGVYDGNTVEEYLEFFAGAYQVPHSSRAAVVRDVMVLTDLYDLRERLVGALSKGMKQRLCLAKTLVHDPKVLLLDEPASALDPRARIEFRVLLKELREMGKTVIISSHILTELSDICDAVAIIERGRLVDSGSIDELGRRDAQGDRIHLRLCREVDGLTDVLSAIPELHSVQIDGVEVVAVYTGEPERFYRIVGRLAEREIPILSVEYNPKDLEDLFLSLTKGSVQ